MFLKDNSAEETKSCVYLTIMQGAIDDFSLNKDKTKVNIIRHKIIFLPL